MKLVATKAGKNKKHKIAFMCGAVKVKYKIEGKEHELWLVITKRENGGYCWLLTRSPKETIIDIIKEAFTYYIFFAVFAPHKTVAAKRNKNIE